MVNTLLLGLAIIWGAIVLKGFIDEILDNYNGIEDGPIQYTFSRQVYTFTKRTAIISGLCVALVLGLFCLAFVFIFIGEVALVVFELLF